jgi:hypothetical protein
MFRAAPGSDKPRRRIDADPAGWQRLRDDLHSLALEYGPTWLELARRVDVCPRMAGRDFELWQPMLALAAWIESHGAGGLLELLQAHALQTIDDSRDDQTPEIDETLLRILADKRRTGEAPTAGEILQTAQEADGVTFKTWRPKTVANTLRRYGLRTVTVRGRHVYNRVSMDDLRRIQTTYGVALDIEENE